MVANTQKKLEIVCENDKVAVKADEDAANEAYAGDITHVGSLMIKQPNEPVVDVMASIDAIKAGYDKMLTEEKSDREHRLGSDHVPEVQALKNYLEAAKDSLADRRTAYGNLRDTYNTQLDTDFQNMQNLQSSRVNKVEGFMDNVKVVLERKEDLENKITSGLIEKRIKAIGRESGVVEQEWKFLPIESYSETAIDRENFDTDVSKLNRVKYNRYTALQDSEFQKAIARQHNLEADAKTDSEAYLAHEKDKLQNALQLSLNALPNEGNDLNYDGAVTDVETRIGTLQQSVNEISTTDDNAQKLKDLLVQWNAADETVASKRAYVSSALETLRTHFERHRFNFECFRGDNK